MSESKADKVSRLIERHVRDTLGAIELADIMKWKKPREI